MAVERKTLKELADEIQRSADRLHEEAELIRTGRRRTDADQRIDDALAKLDEIAKAKR
ncbi:MAG: hypothetical protein M3155_04490 [Actinomycetota bacterium]|nr:hypothetical protein [Actinomycetota bacterium]